MEDKKVRHFVIRKSSEDGEDWFYKPRGQAIVGILGVLYMIFSVSVMVFVGIFIFLVSFFTTAIKDVSK